MTRPRKAWSETVTAHGVGVRLYERKPGGPITLEQRDGHGGKIRKALGHADRARARNEARAVATRLAELRLADAAHEAAPGRGAHARTSGSSVRLTLGALFAAYQAERLPLLAAARQRTVRGYLYLLDQYFGRTFPLEDLSPHTVDGYVAARRVGHVAAAPRPTRPRPADSPAAEPVRRGVQAGTIRNELALFSAVCRWARGYRQGGRPLLTFDPFDGVTIPHEDNTKRPIATAARYAAVLDVVGTVDATGRFRLLLALARHTGRRIRALCELRASDVLRTRAQVERGLAATGQPIASAAQWPHGAIRWRAATDKKHFEAVVPLGADARGALDAYLAVHPRVGDVPLIPAAADPATPLHKETASYWLRRAERLAGVPKLARGVWHPYRRLWASERRHLPAQDVASAGGWRSLTVMQNAYQHADAAGVFSVLDVAAPPAEAAAPSPPAARVRRGRIR